MCVRSTGIEKMSEREGENVRREVEGKCPEPSRVYGQWADQRVATCVYCL